MSAVRDVVIRRFVTVFGEPKTDNSAAMVAEYERALHGTSPEVLHRAVDKLLRKTKFRVWPTIGECMDAVQAAASDINETAITRDRAEQAFDERYPEWSKEAFAIADRMVKCKLGKVALEQDWLLGLYEFIRKERRYPNGNEQKEIIRVTRKIDFIAANKDVWPDPDPTLVGWFEYLKKREIELQGSMREFARSFVKRRKELNERLGPSILEVAQ